jgi:hypothetical protein
METKGELALEEDFYAITYLSYLRSLQIEYSLTKDQRHDYFKRCLQIFGSQVILVILVGYQMMQKDYLFQLGDFPTLVARF